MASASASVIATPSAEIIQGPSSRSTIVGPDGSSISSVSPGGTVIAEKQYGIVAGANPILAPAPVIAARGVPLAYSAPYVTSYSALASPLAYSAPLAYASHAYDAPAVAAYASPAVYAYAAPIAARTSADTVISGPSGTIATSKSVDSPLVAAYGVHGLYL